VSPASKDDWWLVDGGARDSEMRYVQSTAGQQAFEDASRDMAVGALAYDTLRLAVSASWTHFHRSSRPW